MYKLRPREERGKTLNDWLKSLHSFSFAQYFDPFNMGFSDLRVINDDIVEPQSGFDMHRHVNMEIISIVLSGRLEHKDSMGSESIINAGEVQVISSGLGIMHSEFNPSEFEPVHFLQIWILPNKKNTEPEYSKKCFSLTRTLDKLCLVVSGDGRRGTLKIHQDADIYQSDLRADKTVFYEIPENRKIWIQVAKGAIEVNSNILEAGDGMSVTNESGTLEITGVDFTSKFVLFSLRNLSF